MLRIWAKHWFDQRGQFRPRFVRSDRVKLKIDGADFRHGLNGVHDFDPKPGNVQYKVVHRGAPLPAVCDEPVASHPANQTDESLAPWNRSATPLASVWGQVWGQTRQNRTIQDDTGA